MAMRGPAIGRGYLPGFGPVTIFTDLDNTKMLFVQSRKSDSTKYVEREKVEFRK